MASCTKEQENTFDQRVLARSHQCPEQKTSQHLPYSKPPLKTVFGRESSIKQPATALTRVDSNPVTPTFPMEVPNPVNPTLTGKTLGSPPQIRPEDVVFVVGGGSMSLQPKTQVTRSGQQTEVPAKLKTENVLFEVILSSAPFHSVEVTFSKDFALFY